jgi:hypothetical protein
MKTITTITQKNALKLLLFLLILFSAKAFSFSRLPNAAGSSACESRIGSVKKVNNPKAASKTYAMASKSSAMQSKSNKRFKK